MKLGIISQMDEESFSVSKEQGMEFVEIDVNDRAEMFLENVENIKEYSAKYDMPIQAIGRWGCNCIDKDGIIQEELALECRLIESTAYLNCGVYITGCNYIDELSYYENCTLAIQYFEKLIVVGKKYNVKIAIYNCRWKNFVCEPVSWRIVLGHLKDLYIKYDPSHCIYDGGNYMEELRDWGDRFAHVHLKGALLIGGKAYDDPPAGMDMINWPAFLSILYTKGYDGGLSIEPHSRHWTGELGEKGLNRTIKYFRDLLL